MKAPASSLIVLKADEGTALGPYQDHLGNWTYGVGRLIGRSLEDLRISPFIANMMLQEDIDQALADICAVLGEDIYNQMSEPRKVALISLLFTLGRTKFAKFRNTIDAIRKGDWTRAGNEVLLSKWAHDVDPKQREGEGRDDRIAKMLRDNDFDSYYRVQPIKAPG